MNLQDFLTTYAAPKPPRIQARPQPAPTRTLADFLRAHGVPAQQRGLEALAYTAALDPAGRPSDAVRAYLRTHRDAALRRGELLAQARTVMRATPGRRALLPEVPTRFVPRDPSAFGYAARESGFLSTPMLAMEAFSGGGLFSLASALEGNIEVDDCEWSKPAVATRARNRKLLRLAFTPETKDARTWRPPTTTPNGLDLLFGGPPCSPFSKGAELGRSDRERGWNASDNFFPVALDWMCDLQPRVVVWENAPTLVERDDYRRWLTAWQKQARAIGYDSVAHVLDAADFGNPTMRRRTFVFAWPVGASWGEALRVRPEGNFARPGSASVARGDKLPWMPMLDRLTSGCCAGWGLVDCVNLGGLDLACRGCGNGRNFAPAPNTQGEHGRRGVKGVVIETLQGPKPWHLWIRDTVGDKQPRFDKFVPADMAGAWTKIDADARSLALRAGQRVSEYLSRTVVPGFENKAEGLLIPPGVEPEAYGKTRDWQQKNLEQLQRMSVRDAAKLQDIPQWYGFEGTRADAFSQIGMGVPVNLGRGVMAHVRAAARLPVRAPWWETRVPASPRAVRFQSRAQIARTPAGPLVKGEGRGVPDGLWPMDAFDMCFAVPPPLQHGLVLGQWAEDDWQELLGMGHIGAQAQRQEGRSKLDRGADRLPHGQALGQRIARAQQTASLFTDDGLNREALWASGYRGPPEFPPDAMPFAEEFDATDEWATALQYSDEGPWGTVLGIYLRLRYPEDMYDRYGEVRWWEQFTLGDTLPPLDDETRRAFTSAGVPVPTLVILRRLQEQDRTASEKR